MNFVTSYHSQNDKGKAQVMLNFVKYAPQLEHREFYVCNAHYVPASWIIQILFSFDCHFSIIPVPEYVFVCS